MLIPGSLVNGRVVLLGPVVASLTSRETFSILPPIPRRGSPATRLIESVLGFLGVVLEGLSF